MERPSKKKAGEEGDVVSPLQGSRQSKSPKKRHSRKESLSRPGIYPHAPAERVSILESFYGPDVLDHLRTTNYEGFFNLGFLMLGFTLLYMTVRNIREKGLKLNFVLEICPSFQRDQLAVAQYHAAIFLAAFGTFIALKLCVAKLLPRVGFVALYCCSQAVLLVFLPTAVFYDPMAPPYALSVMMFAIVVSLKIHSYFATNIYLKEQMERRAALPKKEVGEETTSDTEPEVRIGRLQFPANVAIGNFFYFIFAPTLVYELNYPRTTKKIRWHYVFTKFGLAAVCFALQYFALMQFVIPVVRQSDFALWYAMMKLAVPNFIMWLLGFYALFHCILNGLAEMLQFGDRMFYQDWWNATTIDVFWRKWNIPVHEWCLRHVYVESIFYYKVTKETATVMTFFLSAVLHEVLFSIAFKKVMPWFFIGMMMQMPLTSLSRQFANKRRGNLLVWLSLFLGQPALEIVYFSNYFQNYSSFFCV